MSLEDALKATVDEIKNMDSVELHKRLMESSKAPFAVLVDNLLLTQDDFDLMAKYSNESAEEIEQLVRTNNYTGMPQFLQTLKWFETTHYQPYIKISEYNELFIYATVTTDSLLLAFTNPHDEDATHAWPSYLYVNGRICFDHYKLFDKWSKACQPYFLPPTKELFDAVIKVADYVGSDEFFNYYNSDEGDDMLHDVYQGAEDIADWSNYMMECVPKHLYNLYKDID